MKTQLKTLFASFLLLIALCFGVFASVSEKRALGDFAGTQQHVGQNPEANQFASLESFGFYQKHPAECCDATNRGVPSNWRQINPAGAQINRPTGFTAYRKPDGDMVHVSSNGLQYGADPKFGNRVDHVLDYTAPNPNKPVHSVFNAQGDDALSLVDEAWTRRGVPDPNDPAAFVVDMGRPIGTAGETSIRVVVKPGTTEIITAYPY